MAGRFDISVLGDKQLADTLATLTAKMERGAIQRALTRTARFVRTLVIGRTPSKSGRLRGSYRAKALKRRRHRVGAMVITGSRATLGIPAQARGFYPLSQEVGWTPRRPRSGRASRGSRGHVAGQRFMRDPLRQAGILAVLRRELDDAIERALLKEAQD